ncbi:MAG: nucleotide exchange factor GrpE [Clostridia bacterium]|nr:nucleotide exchange factor GrpE [Clostridia bacterium]
MKQKTDGTEPEKTEQTVPQDEKAESVPEEEKTPATESETPAETKSEKSSKKEKAKIRQLEDELEKKKKETEELNDKYLRLAAEYANFKNRTAKEKDELFFAAKSRVVKELLPVFDNLDRAKDHTQDADKLAEGVNMILTQFDSILEKLGITEIKALGETFDPEFCEAVFHEEAEDQPENTVTQVLQKGYACDGKVIRHALVKVAN